MALSGLRKFSGRPADLLQYVTVDLTRGVQELFAVLGKLRLEERYFESRVSEFANAAATTVPEDLTSLTLDPGTWDVWGSVLWNPNGATGGPHGRAWISLATQAMDGGVVLGQSYVDTQIGDTATWYCQGVVFRRVSLPERAKVYLGVRGNYTGGPLQRLGSLWAFGRRGA